MEYQSERHIGEILKDRNMIGAAQTERPPLAAVSQKSDQMVWLGGCEWQYRSLALPLPAPTKQTQRAEAGGKERERGWQRCL